MMEEDAKPRRPAYEPGQEIAEMSVADIDEAIALLEGEIERLKSAREAKSAHLSAAEALFSGTKRGE